MARLPGPLSGNPPRRSAKPAARLPDGSADEGRSEMIASGACPFHGTRPRRPQSPIRHCHGRPSLRGRGSGQSNKEIGAALFIAAKTASVHVSNILAKLGASSRTEAAAMAHREGPGSPLHPYLMSQIVSEHTEDMQKQATAARRARQARRGRPGSPRQLRGQFHVDPIVPSRADADPRLRRGAR
jgi:hypothetical protein